MRGTILVLAMFAAGPALAGTLLPGQWQMTSIVTAIDMPGAPPQVLAMMKGKPNLVSQCVTPQDAELGPQRLLSASKGKCRFTRYAMSAGKLDAVMQCAGGPGGGTMVQTIHGTFGPTAFNTSSAMVMTGGRGMKMSATSSGKWIGPCTK